MKYLSRKHGLFLLRPCAAFRALVAVVLVGSLGLEIVPWGFVECPPAAPGEQGGRTLCIEPLQVCDQGDSFLGVLFDLSVLLPGSPCLFPSSAVARLYPEAAVVVPDGFHPAVDHPPQLAALL